MKPMPASERGCYPCDTLAVRDMIRRSVEEITKLERISLSDFTLCGAELLHTEESHQRFFQTCTDLLIVCADCVGMFGRMKREETKWIIIFMDGRRRMRLL